MGVRLNMAVCGGEVGVRGASPVPGRIRPPGARHSYFDTMAHSVPVRLPHRLSLRVCLVMFFVLALPQNARAQDDGRFYVGIGLGGISTVSLIMEQEWEWGSVELMLGSITFRDLSISLVHKQRPGGGPLRGVVGVGLWGILAFPPDTRPGFALAARVPVGLTWDPLPDQRFTAEVALNRALFILRPDPSDEMPPNRRIVPLPGMSYRWLPSGPPRNP